MRITDMKIFQRLVYNS